MAIHEISDMINPVNGEKLEYARRRKNNIIESLQTSRKRIIKGFDHDGVPDTEEHYHDYYRSFDAMPFAFTDIEMVFNEECKAVDWIFRYANEALHSSVYISPNSSSLCIISLLLSINSRALLCS